MGARGWQMMMAINSSAKAIKYCGDGSFLALASVCDTEIAHSVQRGGLTALIPQRASRTLLPREAKAGIGSRVRRQADTIEDV